MLKQWLNIRDLYPISEHISIDAENHLHFRKYLGKSLYQSISGYEMKMHRFTYTRFVTRRTLWKRSIGSPYERRFNLK